MRMGRADADRKKPVERSIEDFIDLFGVPASAAQIAALTAAQYGRDVEYFRGMIERLAPTRPQFFLTPDGKGYFYGYMRMLSELYLVDSLR